MPPAEAEHILAGAGESAGGDKDEEEQNVNTARVELLGTDLINDGKKFSTFLHLGLFVTYKMYYSTTPSGFLQGLSEIFPASDEDDIIIMELNMYLSRVIAGDFPIKRTEDDSIFDIMGQFPLKAIDKVHFNTLEGSEEAGKQKIKELLEEHNEGIESGKIFFISLNALRYWMEHIQVEADPMDTYWKYWDPDSSKQMLGEAIGFKLCLLHSMTCKAYTNYGTTEKEVLDTFKVVQ